MKKKIPILTLVNALIYLFIIAPLIIVIISSFNPSNYLVFPPKGFSLNWYAEVLTGDRYARPFWNSLSIAVITTCFSLPIGTVIAYAFMKYDFRFKGLLQSLFLSPLVIPTLLFGIGMLMYFSYLGFNLHFVKLVLAHIVLTIPYVIRTMMAGFSRLNKSVEEAAINLGAGPVTTFWLVTLPLVRPALMASGFIAMIMSFDELVMALFLTGPGMTTLPMVIYSDIQYNLTPSVAAISSIIIIATVLIGIIGMSTLRRGKIL